MVNLIFVFANLDFYFQYAKNNWSKIIAQNRPLLPISKKIPIFGAQKIN